LTAVAERLKAARAQQNALAALAEYDDPARLDWPAAVAAIEALRAEQATLEAGNSALETINRRLAEVRAELARLDHVRRDVAGDLRSAQDQRAARVTELERAQRVLTAGPGPAPEVSALLAAREWGAPATAADWDRARESAYRELADGVQ